MFPVSIPVSSIQIADSVVNDYCSGLLCYINGISCPGIYYLQGEITQKELFDEKHKPYYDRAVAMQKRWYQELVKEADKLWSRTNGNPISISDDMRLAAQEIGLKDKPWMKDFSTLQMVNCPACGALRNPAYPICGACHTIVDKKMYDSLNLVTTGTKVG